MKLTNLVGGKIEHPLLLEFMQKSQTDHPKMLLHSVATLPHFSNLTIRIKMRRVVKLEEK